MTDQEQMQFDRLLGKLDHKIETEISAIVEHVVTDLDTVVMGLCRARGPPLGVTQGNIRLFQLPTTEERVQRQTYHEFREQAVRSLTPFYTTAIEVIDGGTSSDHSVFLDQFEKLADQLTTAGDSLGLIPLSIGVKNLGDYGNRFRGYAGTIQTYVAAERFALLLGRNIVFPHFRMMYENRQRIEGGFSALLHHYGSTFAAHGLLRRKRR